MSGHGSAPPVVAPSDFWTIDRVAEALTGHAASTLPRGSQKLARVWTDTRSLGAGDLFVALSGEQFDAHNFLADAVKAGASAVVVSRMDAARELKVRSEE